MQKMYKSIKDGKLKFPKWISSDAKSLIEVNNFIKKIHFKESNEP